MSLGSRVIFIVIAIAASMGILFYIKHQVKPQQPSIKQQAYKQLPVATNTNTSDAQIQSDSQSIDDSLNALDGDLNAVDTSLNGQQTNLQ